MVEYMSVSKRINTKIKQNNYDLTIQCPICKLTKKIECFLPENLNNGLMRTIFIEKGAICNHQFIIHLDVNNQIRGYQKISLILNSEKVIQSVL